VQEDNLRSDKEHAKLVKKLVKKGKDLAKNDKAIGRWKKLGWNKEYMKFLRQQDIWMNFNKLPIVSLRRVK
jgi:hypothetical protein